MLIKNRPYIVGTIGDDPKTSFDKLKPYLEDKEKTLIIFNSNT